MATDFNISSPDHDGAGELSEREYLFNAYLEGNLTEEEREKFDERLEDDSSFRREYEEFREVVDGVRNLPRQSAPPDMSRNVRRRIRIRSGGSFFADTSIQHSRNFHEVAAVAMMVVMASTYLVMGVPPDRGLENVERKGLELPPRSRESAPRRGHAPSDSPDQP